MTILNQYGWGRYQHDHYTSYGNTASSVGRVVSVKGFKYYLITGNGELETELSGRLLYGAVVEDLPKVGDWVFYIDYGSMGYITDLFPRMNALARKSAGTKVERQVLAANIDYALIVQGHDRDYNLMRLERYRVQITACGISPIVVLNKADLTEDPERQRAEVTALMQCPAYCCSTLSGMGLREIREQVMEANKTYILIGSSGVGKSSLLNALAGNDAQKTGAVSNSNSKGRHTTTTRDLFQLPNGSLVIDTPGMREFGVTFEEGAAEGDLYPDIMKYASRCRFPDCTHLNEPGCGVLQALESGELDPVLYESYHKLVKEQRRFGIKAEDKKRTEKQFGKLTREAKNHRRKYKY